MATHSSSLAWKIPWTEEPGRLQSMGSLSLTWLSNFTFTFHFPALEKEMATHSSVLAWRIPGMAEPGGLPSMGTHRVRHDWHDLAAAAAHCECSESICWINEQISVDTNENVSVASYQLVKINRCYILFNYSSMQFHLWWKCISDLNLGQSRKYFCRQNNYFRPLKVNQLINISSNDFKK